MRKITFFIIFFLLVAVFFGYWFWREGTFSKEILRFEIFGPDKAKVGEEIEYTVKYKNNGNFLLEQPTLVFEMPENSLTEDGKIRISQTLKDIYPGDEQLVKMKTRLLGKEGDLKTAKAYLSYTPKNLTARYESSTTFTTKIDTVPITLAYDLPSKIEKGKDFQYAINYFSNIDYPLENLSLKIDQVAGFNFLSSSPDSLDQSEWRLPTLGKAQGGRVTVKGNINAETDQKLIFSVSLGMWTGGDFVVIKQATQEVLIIQPLLLISQQVNGSSSYVASPGEDLKYEITFTNIGSSSFDSLYAIVRLDGEALDMATIRSDGGRVQPNDNMIVFDSNSYPGLEYLEKQQSGKISFSVKVKNSWTPSSSDSNSSIISNEVNISQIVEKFSIKVNSGLEISQAVYYQSPDISNSGPVPPKAGQTTTYTVIWSIKNHSGDQKNVKVKAVLPNYVRLTGKLMPENEEANFSFDSASRQIVWSAGDILSGTGVAGDPFSLSFQISFTPAESQKGSTAQLIGTAEVSGENQFTNTITSNTDSAITTALPDDFAHSGGGIIQ